MTIPVEHEPESDEKGSEWMLIDETGDQDSDQGAWSSASSFTSGQNPDPTARPTGAQATTCIPLETQGKPRPREDLDDGLPQMQKQEEGRGVREPWPLQGRASCWVPAQWGELGEHVASRRELVPKMPNRMKEAGTGGLDPITELMVLADMLDKMNASISAEKDKGKGDGHGGGRGETSTEEGESSLEGDQQIV